MAESTIPKRSSVPGKTPEPTDLEVGELAINVGDRRLFSKDANNNIFVIGGTSSGGSSNTIDEIGVTRNKMWTDFNTFGFQVTGRDVGYAGDGCVGIPVLGGTTTGSPTPFSSLHPGTILLRSVANTNSGFFFTFGWNQTANVKTICLMGDVSFDIIFRTPPSFNNVVIRMGMIDTTTANDCVNGEYFELVSSSTISAKTASSNNHVSETITTLTTDTWYHANITVNEGRTGVLYRIFSEQGAELGSHTITENIAPLDTPILIGVIATHSVSGITDLLTVDAMGIDIRNIKRGKLLS